MAAKLDPAVRSSNPIYEGKEYFGSAERESANYNLMLGTAGSPVRINPWNFIGSFNPKKQALAIARDIDVQRGIQFDSSTSQDGGGPENDQESTTSTVRRLPSGAKLPSSAHSIQATTPVKPNSGAATSSTEESINNVAGQSTPLTQGKVIGGPDKQNGPAIKPNSIEEGMPISRPEKTIREDALELREEINRLKELNETQKVIQEKTRIEVEHLKGSLHDRAVEINSLREIITLKENTLVTRDDQLAELRKLLDIKEEYRVGEMKDLIRTMKEIENELLVDKMINDSSVAPGELQTSLPTILQDLKSRILKQQLEAEKAFQMERENWNRKVDELNEKSAMERENWDRKYDELNEKSAAEREKWDRKCDELNEKSASEKGNWDRKIHELIEKSALEKENWDRKIGELNEKFALEKAELEKVNAEKIRQLNELNNEISKSQKTAQDANEKTSTAYSSMENQLHSLREKMEKQLTDNAGLQSRISDGSKLIDELKGDIASAASTTEEAVRNYEKFQKALEEEKRNHGLTKQRMKDTLASFEKFKKFVKVIRLFDVELGPIIMECFEQTSTDDSFENCFRSVRDDIIGFYSKEQQGIYEDLQNNLEKAQAQNKELSDEIQKKWKADLKKETQASQQLKDELEHFKEQNTGLESQKFELAKKLNAIQQDYESTLKQRDATLGTNASLFREIESLKRGKLDEYQDKLSQLFEKFEEFTEIVSKVQNQISLESERQQVLNDSIAAKDITLKQLQEDFQQREIALQQKTFQLKKMQGDISKRITFQLACRSRPDIDRESYASLMIDKVDSIDMVELQNIVKNLILLLEIPFNKLTKKSPLVAIYLKYERPIFSHFANRLHYEIFNEPIEMKNFTNEAYDQYTESHNMSTITHPLESCLENLYQKLVSKI